MRAIDYMLNSQSYGISREGVENILNNEHGLKKVSSRWVQRPLTPDQKCPSLITSRENLTSFEADHAV